jgi:hypothetical protein
MAAVIYKGFYTALQAGDLAGTPDIRCLLTMGSTTCETEEYGDIVNLSDFTDIDEFDGVGYTQLDCASVTFAYVDADDEMQLDFADGSFGDPVAPGSDDISGMLVYLCVDGDPDNDIALGWTDQGGFGVNASNGSLDLTLPATGLMFVRQA